ncbi:hypothetical protein KL86DES1_21362 [uncultured Desulfovibrio sp.]|jgi:hypothetical protein|uniref:Uncharacterized protein n=1 Tax=uncultured Desulfovibrio sp. TaxID=167968 RepID=A0A212L7R1_9BACT|nr:hypothetical protein KL86DES1_21362 [uncultured Desulfovibrio sp.]VZH34260.1 conserved protein of unknown function [Desulfovibrio sp. 86]
MIKNKHIKKLLYIYRLLILRESAVYIRSSYARCFGKKFHLAYILLPLGRLRAAAMAGPRSGVALPCQTPFLEKYPYSIQKWLTLWGRRLERFWSEHFCTRKHSSHETVV